MNRALVPSEVRRQRLEAWVAEYSDAVLRTCYIYLADMASAEDALQETFLKVWRNMDRFEGRNGASVKTWILRIAINTCKNYRKSAWFRRVDRSRILEELPPSVTGVTDESRSVFFEVMELPDKLKQVVLLYYYHGMNMEETAQILKISRAAVQKRLKKAYELLRIQLEGSDADEE